MFSQSLVRPSEGGGGGFQDKTVPAGHRPPPQIFVHGNFLKIIGRKKNMARPPKAPRLPG
ncbi:hypothetical protein FTV92_03310 [Escherichia coli]|nr:hypothetical protein FTV92_03310 [Escherichia coli]